MLASICSRRLTQNLCHFRSILPALYKGLSLLIRLCRYNSGLHFELHDFLLPSQEFGDQGEMAFMSGGSMAQVPNSQQRQYSGKQGT